MCYIVFSWSSLGCIPSWMDSVIPVARSGSNQSCLQSSEAAPHGETVTWNLWTTRSFLTAPSGSGGSWTMWSRILMVGQAELRRSGVKMGETSRRATITAPLRKTHLEFILKKHISDSQTVMNKILWSDESRVNLVETSQDSSPAQERP